MEEQKRDTVTNPGVSGKGINLYCFARSGLKLNVASSRLESNEPVAFLEVGDVTAVYSHVALDDFTGESGERHFQDPAWVVPRALEHERVIEEVMAFSPVFPVRFGVIFSSREALAQVVLEHGKEISCFLDHVVGKEEWCVKGFVDTEKATETLLSFDPVLAGQRQALAASPGARYFQEKRLYAEARTRASRWSRSAAHEIEDELHGLGGESRPQKVSRGNDPGSSREMLLRHAFLVDRKSVGEFRDRVREIGSRWSERGGILELSGPWPPDSFCPVLGKPNP